MSQQQLDLGPEPPPRGVGWVRYQHAVGARYEMTVDGKLNGSKVQHCGHPTANRPYYVVTVAGDILDRKFQHLAEAKAAAIATLPGGPEAELRAIWTEKGVPLARQDEMVAEITRKAQPEYLAKAFGDRS